MGLIAAKPVKPCDRGVFGAFDLLLIPERKSSKTGSIQPNPTQSQPGPGTSMGFCNGLLASPSIRFCLRSEPVFGARASARLLQAAFVSLPL